MREVNSLTSHVVFAKLFEFQILVDTLDDLATIFVHVDPGPE
jgi:hypothetical protein